MNHDPIGIALAEDIGTGDLTSQFFVPEDLHGSGRIFAKEPAVVAGAGTAAIVFRRVDGALQVKVVAGDGTAVSPGETVLTISGPVRSILTGERVALNFLQRLSATATLTRRFVEAVAGTGAAILDTRKTTPGLRGLEKAAVLAGGGQNHRMGLYDMVMVKDNHLTADAAGLRARIEEFRQAHPGIHVEVEADTLEQVQTFLSMPGIDVILLDNMTLEQMREAVRMRAGQPVKLEASGGINLATVREIALTGVDLISVGALTHSAGAIDFSLELATHA
ncbi:MAG TPA: carboxylating nicotinate-nucleotide diphosphorylase [Chthoniobacteraceae bacterium]|nr:carboxylating nicotinate-nucleotide diphosphorylase [Chthoniobacteraceae bacterium]